MGIAFALMQIVVMLHLSARWMETQRERNLVGGLAILVHLFATIIVAAFAWGGE
jgi:hypothetical protein